MPKLKQSFLTIVIGLALVAGLSYAWTGPTATPPNNNASAPINVSNLSQIKTGALQVNGFRNIGNSIFDGSAEFKDKVGIGTNSPQAKLDVAGKVRISDGTQGDGKVLTSDASGNASWANLFSSNTLVFKRSASYEKDMVIWCPDTHPYKISCTAVDDQAPPASSFDEIDLLSSCDNDGKCDMKGVRGYLGPDNIYLETVRKYVNGQSVWGCLAYDQAHAHKSYKLDLICSIK